jgi:hypothetical protein
MKPILIPLLAATLAVGARADVSCQVGGADLPMAGSLADFNYSASGKAGGSSGRVSLFRLMAGNEGEDRRLSIELKTVDVSKPGEYPVVDESGWRSVIRVQGKKQRVTGGKFQFSRFEMRGHTGRAAGSVEFTTEQTRGRCTFDVEVKGIERDRLGL